MSSNINQIYIANPVTTNLDTDLIYVGRSPYAATDDAAIDFADFKAQFVLAGQPSFREGAIGFFNASNKLIEDKTGLFWDDATNRLGINCWPVVSLTTPLNVGGIISVFDSAVRTFNAGISTEASATLINFGINDGTSNRFGGSYSSADQGGLIRFDGRNAQPLVQILGRVGGVVGGATTIQYITAAGNFALSAAALATTATDNFPYMPTCPGVPTGVPTALAGLSPFIYDSTGNNFYIYNSSWRHIPTGTGAFTAGSVIFAGTGGVLSQDNANFFWDDTNNRLGIGTITPNESLQVANNARIGGYGCFGGQVYFTGPNDQGAYIGWNRVLGTGSTSFANQRGMGPGGWEWISYSNLNVFEMQAMALGSTGILSLPAYTTGSILFIGASGAVSQDNAEFFWDDTNNRLGLGTASPTHSLTIFRDVAGVSEVAKFRNDAAINIGNYTDILLALGADQTFGTRLRSGAFGVGSNTFQIYLGNGNSSTEQLLMEFNNVNGTIATTMYGPVTLNSMTANSVLFAGTSGLISQDTAGLVFNSTSNYLGVNTSTPHCELQLGNTLANRKLVLYEDTDNDHQYYGLGINTATLRYQVSSTTGVHKFYAGTSTTTSDTLFTVTGLGSVVVKDAAVTTTATDGFLYITSCAGIPTGVPTAFTGRVPMVYDSTNNDFYIYNGAWKKVALA